MKGALRPRKPTLEKAEEKPLAKAYLPYVKKTIDILERALKKQ